ncbi:hypothetical protein, partial [Raoultella planticola]|uniref:hypothetical protein n=1 Tax=Raoultella planticola TaxID=575 RepID=UPI00223AD591
PYRSSSARAIRISEIATTRLRSTSFMTLRHYLRSKLRDTSWLTHSCNHEAPRCPVNTRL